MWKEGHHREVSGDVTDRQDRRRATPNEEENIKKSPHCRIQILRFPKENEFLILKLFLLLQSHSTSYHLKRYRPRSFGPQYSIHAAVMV